MDGSAAARRAGRQQTALLGIACFWVLAAWPAVTAALHSDWPPPRQLPTAEQVHDARTAVWVAAAVTVTPLAGGLLLAGRWRKYGWAIGFGVLLMFAVLGSGLLVQAADG